MNETSMAHEAQVPYGAQWEYLPATELPREVTEVMVETEVKKALVRLNPEIAAQPERAEIVDGKAGGASAVMAVDVAAEDKYLTRGQAGDSGRGDSIGVHRMMLFCREGHCKITKLEGLVKIDRSFLLTQTHFLKQYLGKVYNCVTYLFQLRSVTH